MYAGAGTARLGVDALYAADASRAEGSDVRVMSVNMLVHMES